jgi:hypothetical protein
VKISRRVVLPEEIFLGKWRAVIGAIDFLAEEQEVPSVSMARMAWAALLAARPPPTRMYLKCGALIDAYLRPYLYTRHGA